MQDKFSKAHNIFRKLDIYSGRKRLTLFEVLVVIGVHTSPDGWIEQADLCRVLEASASRSNMSNTVAALTARGFIRTFGSPSGNQRQQAVRLTPKGKEVAAYLLKVVKL